MCCLLGMDEAADKVLMSGARLDLCKEIGIVGFAGRPDDVENISARAISKPVVAHIVRFGFSELDCIVSDSDCGYVICVDDSRRLWIAEGGQDCAFEVGMLTVDVERGILGFGSGAAYGSDRAAEC